MDATLLIITSLALLDIAVVWIYTSLDRWMAKEMRQRKTDINQCL